MPRPTPGKSQIATQVSEDVAERFKAYYEGRGETLSMAVERAILREMRTPPPPPQEPPPFAEYDEATDAPPAAQRQGSGRKKGKAKAKTKAK